LKESQETLVMQCYRIFSFWNLVEPSNKKHKKKEVYIMAIRAKRNRLLRVSEEARIGNGIILEKGDRILVLREDEIPNVAADETRDPENDVGYDIVDDAAADFSQPTQESRRAALRKKMEMARRKREMARRRKMREDMIIDEEEDMIIDEEDETSEEPVTEEEDGEEVADKVEERYARILRRREAARRAMRTRSSVRESGVRKPLSIVERKARLARAKREMMLRRRARLGR